MSWVIAVVMVLHGLIHFMGGLNELDIAKMQGLSGKTLIPLTGPMHPILGALWLIAAGLFILSAVGLVVKRKWWKSMTILAVIISEALIIIWWPDAKWGTLPNLLILLGYFFNRGSAGLREPMGKQK